MIVLFILVATIVIETADSIIESEESMARLQNAGMVVYGALIFIAPLAEVLAPLEPKELLFQWLMNSLYYAIITLLVRWIVCLRNG